MSQGSRSKPLGTFTIVITLFLALVGNVASAAAVDARTVAPASSDRYDANVQAHASTLALLAKPTMLVADSPHRPRVALAVLTSSPPSGLAAEDGGGGKAFWGFWSDYDKVTVGDREYADINGRLYTQHAVERMTPSGFGNAAGGVAGRSISPNYVEDVLDNPESVTPVKGPDGEARLSYVSGSVQVITENGIVVTVITR